MISQQTLDVLDSVKQSGCITSNVVEYLREEFISEGIVNEVTADLLLDLHHCIFFADVSWHNLLVETLSDYVVYDLMPDGYVTVDNAEWLIENISYNGRIDTIAELEILVNVLEKATWSPELLVEFALRQVYNAVCYTSGALREGTSIGHGMLLDTEVQLLRRILTAFGGDSNVAITRREAEILLDINDAAVHVQNHVGWSELFIKSIANHVMAGSDFQVPTRAEALCKEIWLHESLGVVGFMQQMVSYGFEALSQSYHEPTDEELELEKLEREKRALIVGEAMTREEVSWLVERIGVNGLLNDNERALVQFLKTKSKNINKALKPLIDLAA